MDHNKNLKIYEAITHTSSEILFNELNQINPTDIEDSAVDLEMTPSPKERIRARAQANLAERAILRGKYGDPVKRLANLLSNLPPEIIETLVEYGEDGLLYVRRD